jgi:hypothetical protein
VITASDWRPYKRNTLQGFSSLHLLPSGMTLRDCSFHQHENGSEWIGLPGKPPLDEAGMQRRDTGGKALYTPVVEIADRAARQRFQTAAVAAVHVLIDRAPATSPPSIRRRPGRLKKPSPPPDSQAALPDDDVRDLWR